jgi:aryl-alcohol dehydrogenase-like predicted oxidoreductase
LKLGLGTAQFGQAYGVANNGQVVPAQEAADIVAFAGVHDIGLLDTAADYGSCESMLGNMGVGNFSVVSKLPAIPDSINDATDWVKLCLASSRERLRLDNLYGVLLHRPLELLGSRGQAIYEGLLAEKAAGHVDKIGISVYNPEELALITREFKVDIVQLPCNVLDQRFLDTGWLARLQDEGVEVHARSAFLQGLLLMQTWPDYFSRWHDRFRDWHKALSELGLDPVEACLAFLKSNQAIDRIIVGAVSLAQIEHIVDCFQRAKTCCLPDISSQEEALLNPSLWRLE